MKINNVLNSIISIEDYNGDDIILLELQKDTLYEKYNDRAEIIAELKNNLKEVGIVVDDDYINKHFGYVNGSFYA